ncbi:hypothetical protein GA0111570_104100 [Raineyella antarctica]|uniref:Uncharacterized protein n=1 Tax=Raineyella antarctica TaxID=1577474 RepID=A0A1G6GMJ7_9ACTN|nr:hypothetical protein [Raineyella antarctica]SDB83164.1 hypothetical protein GA0111570_104100 [Raineyella antarctica]
MPDLVHLLLDTGVMIAFGAVAVLPGSPLVTWVFRRIDRADAGRALSAAPERPEGIGSGPTGGPGQPGADTPGGAGTPPGQESPASLQAAGSILRGGRWIGNLERLAVFVSIAAGYPNGVAVSVAVKALARYPELKATTSAAAERFIIGTFVSVLWACAWAGTARWALTLY